MQRNPYFGGGRGGQRNPLLAHVVQDVTFLPYELIESIDRT